MSSTPHHPHRSRSTTFALMAITSLALTACGGGDGGTGGTGGVGDGGSGGTSTQAGGGGSGGGQAGSGGISGSGGKGGSGGTGGAGGTNSGGKGGAGGKGGSSGSGGGNGGGGGNSGSGGAGGSGGTAVGGNGGTSGGAGGTGGGTGGVSSIYDPPCSTKVDKVAPSINPPGGLTPAQVPQFVMFGFDDNAFADGINWVLDTFRDRKNADGTRAAITFFITAGFASDYFNPTGGQTKDDVLNAWKKIKSDGHEIGNHTWSHSETLAGSNTATWLTEVTKARDLFVNTLGIEKCKLAGFRTPFLGFSQFTFDAIKQIGIQYDTSVEFGYDWWQPAGSDTGWGPGTIDSGKHYYWPFTMDQAFPNGFASRGVTMPPPGMWEFPAYTFNNTSGDMVRTITGLDYNLWTSCQNDPTMNFTNVLKGSLDQRLAGNRSPFAVGAHSDIYSQFDESANTTWTKFDYQARRKAMAAFIDYALSKPEVRVVTFRQLIEWMRNPKPL